MNNFINNFILSLKNNDEGYSQRKLAVAGIMTTVLISNMAYIANCTYRNQFDSIFLGWQAAMIGFVSATFVALYGNKNEKRPD